MKSSKREIPSDMQVWGWKVAQHAPENNLQQLMEEAPGTGSTESLQQTAPTREAVRRVIENLTPFDRFMVEASHFERLPIRDIAARIGVEKSQAQRLLTRVNNRLATALLDQPAISRKVTMQEAITDPEDWRTAAEEALIVIEQNAAFSPLHKTFEESMQPCIDYVHRGWREVPITLVDEGILDIAITAWLGLNEDAHNRMLDLLCDRQAKYGPNNILKFGTKGIIIRMSDKIERIATASGDFTDETTEDAYMDLVGYAAIHWLLANDIFELPLL